MRDPLELPELKLPDALALDFDGVLCNGLKEYFQTALKAYGQLWPEVSDAATPEWEPAFGRLRPVVETGWEMPVVLRAIAQGFSESEILANWPPIREQVLSISPWNQQQIGHQVDVLRDQWIADDLSTWLGLHEFYPGVATALSQWIAQDFPLFIVTTKESRFVQALLETIGITLSPSVIFGKDAQQPKVQTLRDLQGQGFQTIWFVEDRLATLQGIVPHADLQQVGLFLADWGYNTMGDRQVATDHDTIRLLPLATFGQGFAHWLS